MIRVWVIGCSTGEEAYSIAILLQEQMEKLKQKYKVQMFATDIDSRTIEQARKGVYPANISADVSPERLKRYFVHDPKLDTYSIEKNIRDMIIFSEQDLIMDPPFSKMDLISCRNLLIYLNRETQNKLIPMFHYALNPGGFLLLGSSESIGEFSNLFDTVDRQSRLYQSKAIPRPYSIETFLSSSQGKGIPQEPSRKPSGGNKLQLRELTEKRMLQEYAPAGVLVDERGDILYFQGETGPYLRLPSGEPSQNILKMARKGLKEALTAALRKSVVHKEQVTRSGLRVKTNGDFTIVNLKVRPLEEAGDQKLFLVTFEIPSEPVLHKEKDAVNESEEESVAALKEELRTTEEYLKSANEELEISNEELKSSNEEMQSMNEEFQSTNEELETSREELQSVNEELITVNNELQTKIGELSEANEETNKILASTNVGIIIVDNQLRIRRFTPAATKVINLIPTDVGRPIKHTVSNISGYNNLIPDIQGMLDSLVPVDIEVSTDAGEWYVMAIRPYLSLKNEVEGAVITFTEITRLKEKQEEQVKTLRRLSVVVQDSVDAIVLQDMEGNIMAWNPMAENMYGWNEDEALSMNISSMIPEDRKDEESATLKKLIQAEIPQTYRTQRLTKDGRIIDVWVTSTPLADEDGNVYSVSTTERQIKY
ncbi:CheR family methyltransferase [Methanolobus sp.]|uniref:CheR family methyltransferase n=1 Tax=Methanolobus sp. TaxID=1874737 RepID=UPI0025FBE1A7|nr:CheR family methyltransferase [Methanolobus sp.]